MTKKMREIFAKFEEKSAQAREFQNAGKIKEAQAAIEEAKDLREMYNSEKELYELEKFGVPEKPEPTNKINGWSVMAKVLRHKSLTEAENALVTGGSSGENYLVPEDVDTQIRQYRKTYASAKELCTVITTNSLKGSFTFEGSEPAGLTNFDDGDDVPSETNPTFKSKPWAIKLMGKVFPVSNVLLDTEQAGLGAYINQWFVRNSIISENADIFAALKSGKSGTDVTGLLDIRKQKNTAIDPGYLNDGVIITNQSGFVMLDNEVDENGRPLLSTDLQNPTRKLFDGLPIVVFPDSQLKDETSKHPVFVGSIKSAVYFIQLMGLQFASSKDYYFGKNQTAVRVIEGYAVMQADDKAYTYLLLGAE